MSRTETWIILIGVIVFVFLCVVGSYKILRMNELTAACKSRQGVPIFIKNRALCLRKDAVLP